MKRPPLLFLLALSLPSAALAQEGPCANADPDHFEQVYACLSSLQRSDGRTMAHGNLANAPCRSVLGRYNAARRGGPGIRPRERAERREPGRSPPGLPSCALLARVVREMTGQAAYWAGCLDYGASPPADHLSRCLQTVLPGFYGAGQGRGAQRLQGCGDVFGAYEIGLRAATADNGLPPGYVRPDCRLAADVLAQQGAAGPPASVPLSPSPSPPAAAPANPTHDAPAAAPPSTVPPPVRSVPLPGAGAGGPQWAACLDYDPGNLPAHLRACLGTGREMRRMKECREVQAAYMARLKQAYGRLPKNHIVLPCPVADGYLAEFRAEEEAERQAALERKKEQERLNREKRVKDADDLRENPPPRPLFARPWVTWVILLSLIGGAGWGIRRFSPVNLSALKDLTHKK